jgi:hypothetical protein
MISLSQLLGGRKKRRTTRRKTTRRKTTRKGRGLVGGRRKKTTRRKTTRRRGRGLVGGDLALAQVYRAIGGGGTLGADPAVLDYYQRMANRGGRRKRRPMRRRRGGAADIVVTKPYEASPLEVYDPELYELGISEYTTKKGERARKRRLLKEEEDEKGLYDEVLASIPRKHDPIARARVAAAALAKARTNLALSAAEDIIRKEMQAKNY